MGERIIRRLRKRFRNVFWTYDAKHNVWNGDDGSQVRGTWSLHDDEEMGLPPVFFRYWPGTAQAPERLPW